MISYIRVILSEVPLLGWLLGALMAIALEFFIGTPLARVLGMYKAPMLFGFVIMLKKPMLIPSAILYFLLIYLLPIGLITLECTDNESIGGQTSRISSNSLCSHSSRAVLRGFALVVGHEPLPGRRAPIHLDSGLAHVEFECDQRLYGRIFLLAPGVHGFGGVCRLSIYSCAVC